MNLKKAYRRAVKHDQRVANAIAANKKHLGRFEIHPVVAETIDVLTDPNLVWDKDFDQTRLPLADLLTSIGHLAIIEYELLALCEPIVQGDDDLRDGLL
jgi:hypothetical protein